MRLATPGSTNSSFLWTRLPSKSADGTGGRAPSRGRTSIGRSSFAQFSDGTCNFQTMFPPSPRNFAPWRSVTEKSLFPVAAWHFPMLPLSFKHSDRCPRFKNALTPSHESFPKKSSAFTCAEPTTPSAERKASPKTSSKPWKKKLRNIPTSFSILPPTTSPSRTKFVGVSAERF